MAKVANKLLVIGLTYPEPETTAAGGRMVQLLNLFTESGYHIHFATTAGMSDKAIVLQQLQIETHTIALNNESFDAFITQIDPQVVLFDRYITEEQFGWRVAERCPNAVKILDTEDLHFLRKAREHAVKTQTTITPAALQTDIAKREIASIVRCDLSLLISEVEYALLVDSFKLPKTILYYLPFLTTGLSEEKKKNLPLFEERKDFVVVGNLLHAPNVDAVVWLKKEIWPGIKAQLPEASLHIYGAYAPQKILQLHDTKEGFLVKGWAEDVGYVMEQARVSLAPLRFGAGLKGKVFTAMQHGTPTCTTPTGAEGIADSFSFPGTIDNATEAFVEASVAMYTDKEKWLQAQQKGYYLLEKKFHASLFSEAFKEKILHLRKHLIAHREDHFFGQLLQHHTLHSARYLSKFIEAKNKFTS